MQETEAKFFVQDIRRTQVRLRSLEARLIQDRILETNLRFDLPDGRLSSEQRVLRLRRDSKAHLTYKGPSESIQGVLRRTEIEFVVENLDRARTFLEALGYQIIFTYEKFRTIYELGDTHIMLDELPFGDFVEIEGADVGAITANADRLNFNRGASITAGYHVLYEGLCAKRPDLDPRRLTFDALNGKVFSPGEFSLPPADR